MDRYTIHCTQEQTRKAIELGAPIEFESEYYNPTENDFKLENPIICRSFTYGYHYAKCPTADQMIGWLEEQRLFIHIDYDFHANDKPYKCEMCTLNGLTRHCGWFTSREEATIASIDAALEYLFENKKKEEIENEQIHNTLHRRANKEGS